MVYQLLLLSSFQTWRKVRAFFDEFRDKICVPSREKNSISLLLLNMMCNSLTDRISVQKDPVLVRFIVSLL